MNCWPSGKYVCLLFMYSILGRGSFCFNYCLNSAWHGGDQFVALLRWYGSPSSPSWELQTASPRGRYGERRQRDSCLKHTHIKTPPVGRRQPMTSLSARPQYKGRRENTSSTSSSEACVRSMAHSLGDTVSRSPLGEPWLHT